MRGEREGRESCRKRRERECVCRVCLKEEKNRELKEGYDRNFGEVIRG